MHKIGNVFCEDLRYDPLECSWGRLEAEHHHHGYENLPLRYEGSFLLVLLCYAYLIVSVEAIEECLHCMARYYIKLSVREWKGKCAIYGCFIQLLVINADT